MSEDKEYIYKRRSYLKHKKSRDAELVLKMRECLSSWVGFIPIETKCEVCGTIIYFNKHEKRTAIHFDHRNEGMEVIKGVPSSWLRTHRRTPENEVIWKSCNFGMLCAMCNIKLPTVNRKSFMIKANEYVFGKGLSL